MSDEKREPEIEGEFVLGVERIHDHRRFSPVGGGDCYVCSSSAILNYFLDEPPSLEEVYQRWVDVGVDNGPIDHETEDFWWSCKELGIHWVSDPPYDPEPNPGYKLPSMFSHASFARRAKVYLEAGYLIHAQVLMDRESDLVKQGKQVPRSNHLVVIDGYRRVTHWRKIGESWGGRITEEFHVICSSKRNPEPYWMSADELVEEHHAFGMWFIRDR